MPGTSNGRLGFHHVVTLTLTRVPDTLRDWPGLPNLWPSGWAPHRRPAHVACCSVSLTEDLFIEFLLCHFITRKESMQFIYMCAFWRVQSTKKLLYFGLTITAKQTFSHGTFRVILCQHTCPNARSLHPCNVSLSGFLLMPPCVASVPFGTFDRSSARRVLLLDLTLGAPCSPRLFAWLCCLYHVTSLGPWLRFHTRAVKRNRADLSAWETGCTKRCLECALWSDLDDKPRWEKL